MNLLFDLDGVLIDSQEMHRTIFDQAVRNFTNVDLSEYHGVLEGRPTREKLNMLVKLNVIDPSLVDSIYKSKQELTQTIINDPDLFQEYNDWREDIAETFLKLHYDRFNLAICTNSIYSTTICILQRINLLNKVRVVMTNEDAKPKPDPEMYDLAIDKLGSQYDSVIFEDSVVGLQAATQSKAKRVIAVRSFEDMSYDYILENALCQ